MPAKTCFIISPIGQEGSPAREHANDVFDFIIKPAMEECGVEAFRSDHLYEPGRISEQMFAALAHESMCVAVLTGNNPNVFYELAIAQAAGKPLIILLEKGQVLPFDIQDLRCVYYDLKLRAFKDRTYIREVVEHIRAIEAAGWKAKSPFEGLIDPESKGLQNKGLRYFDRALEFGNTDAMLPFLENAGRTFDTVGSSLNMWKQATHFRKVLTRKAQEGCKARLLLMHPKHPLLPHMISPDADTETCEEIVQKLESGYEFFRSIAQNAPNVEVRQVVRGCIYLHITVTDNAAIATQFLYGQRSRHSPLVQTDRDSRLYTTLAHEFETLWEANAPGGNHMSGGV